MTEGPKGNRMQQMTTSPARFSVVVVLATLALLAPFAPDLLHWRSPSPPLFERLVEQFQRVMLDPPGSDRAFWRQRPSEIRVASRERPGAPGRRGAARKQILSLGAELGLDLRQVPDARDVELAILEVPHKGFRRLRHFYRLMVPSWEHVRLSYGCSVTRMLSYPSLPYGARFLIRMDTSEDEFQKCVALIAASVLGMTRPHVDACAVRPSLFCANDSRVALSKCDVLLFKALYSLPLKAHQSPTLARDAIAAVFDRSRFDCE